MRTSYLHDRKDFSDLLRLLEKETGILAYLIEKDYWIMHVLYGLTKMGLEFELKGGTSLSKGYQFIQRFSEDIDIHIHPPKELAVNTNPKKTKPNQIKSRKEYYDWLAENINIDGIVSIERDTAFDDKKYYRSGGIRLQYESQTDYVDGVKEGILLEVGFDTVTPNKLTHISSWAYDKAVSVVGGQLIDNKAYDIACYHPGYTLVEKLQTIATKYRQEQETGKERSNLMRQYYDVYCLLAFDEICHFIGTEPYLLHKQDRFPKKDQEVPIRENEAFLLGSIEQRQRFKDRYQATAALYYKGQPEFNDILERIREHINRL
ncbi:nucleotidyl transferase AbiEii/AbiGii toxin family protein [Sphingobacterium sp. UT-1RO-CII-1]|uniref:nucleotidyl transferase AbiEii/AbiGii toxin family protein n=1 Tax=Sphingobacterium sp. UT-1RO-CII-1 TaxID=2995225 RepID=UPI00227C298E|nr:nucleotidyl transferase AbiEii/AbiGii toxin family protein [Sphingobacterium sp. UT-1RO-CII-1]MCY4780372.1 nucleotidyl transferase AbiEii/AbiGii toxin family protein [Sphingobacterium sp. UT-1RO-CII-1]